MPQPIAAALPFAIDQGGSVQIQPSATAQLRDRVTALASTQPGARVAAVNFGVNTARILFDWNDPLSSTQLAHELTEAMRVYEPGARLNSVTPVMNPGTAGVAGVLADATRADVAQGQAGGYATVFIDAGGDVTDYASTTPR